MTRSKYGSVVVFTLIVILCAQAWRSGATPMQATPKIKGAGVTLTPGSPFVFHLIGSDLPDTITKDQVKITYFGFAVTIANDSDIKVFKKRAVRIRATATRLPAKGDGNKKDNPKDGDELLVDITGVTAPTMPTAVPVVVE